MNFVASPKGRVFVSSVRSYGRIASGLIIVIFPVYPYYLKVSQQFRPAAPPPIITKFLLSFGSLLVIGIGLFYSLIPPSGTLTKYCFPYLTISYFGTPSSPGALFISPVTILNPAA